MILDKPTFGSARLGELLAAENQAAPIEKVTLIDSYLLPREVYADDIRSLCVYAGMLGMPMSLVRGVNDDAHLSALNAMVRETDVKREPIVGLSELADMTQERRLSVLYERARGQGFFESMSEKRFRDGYAVLRSNLDAMHKYKPAHWQGRITFFRGTGNPQDGPDSMAYWSQAADMKVIEVPGNHLTVMSGDSLRMIMDAIRADA